MGGQVPPDPLPQEWVESFRGLYREINKALSTRDPAKRDELSVGAMGHACQVLEELMRQQPFAAAMRSVANQDPGVIVAAIDQLRAGDLQPVVRDLGELLNRAGVPYWSVRTATVEAITGLLTGDPAMLGGGQAVQVLDQFRSQVCQAETWLHEEIDQELKDQMIRVVTTGIAGAALVGLGAGVAALATVPAAIATAAGLALVGPAVVFIGLARRYGGH
jgi:hypothetical protein